MTNDIWEVKVLAWKNNQTICNQNSEISVGNLSFYIALHSYKNYRLLQVNDLLQLYRNFLNNQAYSYGK